MHRRLWLSFSLPADSEIAPAATGDLSVVRERSGGMNFVVVAMVVSEVELRWKAIMSKKPPGDPKQKGGGELPTRL